MKKVLMLSLFAVLFFLPINVKALNVDYEDIIIYCPDVDENNLDVGEQFTCYLIFYGDIQGGGPITKISMNYSLSGLEVVSHKALSGWKETTFSKSKIEIAGALPASSGGTVSGDFSEIKFRVTSATLGGKPKISITNSYFMIQGYSEQLKFGNVSKTFKINNCSNTLSKLLINNSAVSGFSASKTSYSINTDKDTVNINPTKQCSSAKITGSTGNQSLKVGSNKFTFTVTSPKGTKRSYTVTATRTDARDKNANLSLLLIQEGNIDFSKDKTAYSLNVPYSVTGLSMTYETESPKSTVTVVGANDLKVGDNVVTLTVKSEAGNTKIYTINVTRAVKPPVLLKDLKVAGYDIKFDPDLTMYQINGTKFTKKLDITYIKQNQSDTVVVVGNKDLVAGNNNIQIKVVDKNLEEIIYNIKYFQESAPVNNTLIIVLITGVSVLVVVVGALFLRRKLKPRRFIQNFDDDEEEEDF